MPKTRDVHPPLALINIFDGDNKGYKTVETCIIPENISALAPEGVESRAAIGLDASASMLQGDCYGGRIGFRVLPNHMEALARQLGEKLTQVTRNDDVHMFYWALDDGAGLEEIGRFTDKEVSQVAVPGPKAHKWGKGTCLLPAIRHIFEKVGAGAQWVIGVLITDGFIQDEEACMKYCMEAGEWLHKNSDLMFKLILIGVGKEVDGDQLVRFDDMFEETKLRGQIDLWCTGKVQDIKNDREIINILFGELAREDVLAAGPTKVLDDKGNLIHHFTDGLPSKFRVDMPESAKAYTLQVGDQTLVQSLDIQED